MPSTAGWNVKAPLICPSVTPTDCGCRLRGRLLGDLNKAPVTASATLKFPTTGSNRTCSADMLSWAKRLHSPSSWKAFTYAARLGLSCCSALPIPCCTRTLTPCPGNSRSRLARMNCFHACLCGCSSDAGTFPCMAVACACTSTCPMPPFFAGRLATAAAGRYTSCLPSSRMAPRPSVNTLMRR